MTPTLITFYSFKGGVGRTQALANVAVALALRGKNVVVVDMDLESPGLHAFFHASQGQGERLTDAALAGHPGVLEFLERASELPEEEPRITESLIECKLPRTPDTGGRLRLLPAGDLSRDYPHRVNAFSWERFYEEQEGYRFLELLRQQLFDAGADYVLLDSRTGVTDVGQVCTFQLPEILVVLFALHEQGLEGTRRLAEAIKHYREEEGKQARLRRVLLVPSRVDEIGEHLLLEQWVQRTRLRLEGLGELFADPKLRIPYVSQSAYGENIVVEPIEPNLLSEAYERLVERITGEKATPQAPAQGRRSFSALRDELAALGRELGRLEAEAKSFQETVLRFPDLPDRALQLRKNYGELLRRIGSLQRDMAALGLGDGLSDVPRSETLAELEHTLAALRDTTEQSIEAWIQKRREELRGRFSNIEADEELARAKMEELAPLLEDGQWEEIKARLPAILEELQRNSVNALLKRDALERDRLLGRFPEADARHSWLDERLRKLLEEMDIDAQETALVLRNLLRLRSVEPGPPERLHWDAYEWLCLFDKEGAAERAVFECVGQFLWQEEWRALFAIRADVDGLEEWYGREAREQLQRLDRKEPALLEPIVTLIEEGIRRLQTGSADVQRPLQTILERRHHDPCVRRAMLRLRAGGVAPVKRRELISAWLSASERLSEERALITELVYALVEEEQDAEAFYFFCALARRNPALLEEEALELALLAFLLRAARHGRSAELQRLLAETNLWPRILKLRAGRAVLALWAGEKGTVWEGVQEFIPLMRSELRRLSVTGESLPPRMWEWIEQYDTGMQLSMEQQQAIEKILGELQVARRPTFFKKWEPSRWYEEQFTLLVDARREALLVDTRAPTEIDSELERLDVHAWIKEALRNQGRPDYKNNYPDGPAFARIRDAFTDLIRLLQKLNHLRPSTGRPTLSELLRPVELRRQAYQNLMQWLRPRSDDLPADHLLLPRVAAWLKVFAV